jgi:hypothetical protein
MLELGIVAGAAFKSALVGGTLSTTLLPAERKLFALGDPTENTRSAQTIISYSPLPRSLISILSKRGQSTDRSHFQYRSSC